MQRPQTSMRLLALAGVSSFALVAPTMALAQAAAAPNTVEQVVVTASRVVRDGYQAPTPTTVVGVADLQKQSLANVADAIQLLPQAGRGFSSRSATFLGNAGMSSFNLRSLDPTRTLVLLDGHRVVQSGLQNVVDTNLLPMNLVSRVDVVTGGASAAWGSDAVAGVVNLVLDKNFTGLKGSMGYGAAFVGDARNLNADLAFGTKFADGRGHFLASFNMERSGNWALVGSRDWFTGYKAVGNPAFTPTNGQPGLLVANNVGFSSLTPGGVITSGPLRGQQFGPNGTILPFRPTFGAPGSLVGVGPDTIDLAGDQTVVPRHHAYAGFLRASYDITDNVNVYAEAGLGQSYGINQNSVTFQFSPIFAGNPFIPAGLDMTGVTSFVLGRVNYDREFDNISTANNRKQQRYVVGADGSTDWFNDTFKWNAYYQYGRTAWNQDWSKNSNRIRMALALDVVRNPATGGVTGVAAGVPVCRSTLTNPTNGCVPFNPFGQNSPSDAAIDYVRATSYRHVRVREDVAAFGFSFEPFSLPAGPVSMAAGAEWRKEQVHSTVDPDDTALPINVGAFALFSFKPIRGSYNVKEAFVETVVPILKDVSFAKALDFNGAIRQTDYSTSGMVTTWKVGGTWDVNDELRFRGTRSRDIRAPNLDELFRSVQANTFQARVPGQTTGIVVFQAAGGNPNLDPEKADTTSYGVVYRPNWFPGFSASLDRYKIGIKGAIVSLTSQQILDQCYGANGNPVTPSACALITLNPNPATPGLVGQLNGASVNIAFNNIAGLNVAGWDFNATYRRELSDLVDGWVGAIDLRADGTWVTKWTQTLGLVTTSYNNTERVNLSPGPAWRWLFTATYDLGPSSTTATIRYLGGAQVNHSTLGQPDYLGSANFVEAIAYLDLNQSWNVDLFGAKGQVFARIENVFDTDPPKVPNLEPQNYAISGTELGYYDGIGRAWRLGFRFKY